MPKIYIVLLILLFPLSLTAQRKIKYSAKNGEAVRIKGESRQHLWDSVVYEHNNIIVFCDSSVLYKQDNRMDSFGNVRIVDDSTSITSKKLFYHGNVREARLRDDVVYIRGKREMYTDNLDYDIETEVAHYFNGGKLIDTTNILTSQIAFYYAKEEVAVFYKDVVLVSPDFELKTDTLRYNTLTKVAYTTGLTEIVAEDGTKSYSNGGEFRTEIKQSEFIRGNIETEDYILDGDVLFFDDLAKFYKSKGNVQLTAKEKDVILIGDEGYYDKEKGISKIYGNAIMKRVMEQDTFYLAADTLIAIESDYDSLKRILAYPDIRIFRGNTQGLADSVAYFLADSMIYMYFDPVLWTDKNQISADTIIMELTETEIRKMFLQKNAFMISVDTIQNYNQIKGREMVAFFEDNDISHVDVEGNCESIFHSLDKGDSTLLGMNRLVCGRMIIRFGNNQIENFTVFTNPEGRFVPPHEITKEDKTLSGFDWKEEFRPKLEDIYTKPAHLEGPSKPRPVIPSIPFGSEKGGAIKPRANTEVKKRQ